MNFIPSAERTTFVRFQLTIAVTIIAYGIGHDQWLMFVSREHFTAYHDNIISIHAPRLNTAALAFCATLGPGLLLGILSWVAARWDAARERRSLTYVWRRLIVLLAVVEMTAFAAGVLSHQQFAANGVRGLLLPEWCYFEMKADLVVAQTIQLVTYGAAAVGSAAYLSIVWFGRRRVPC